MSPGSAAEFGTGVDGTSDCGRILESSVKQTTPETWFKTTLGKTQRAPKR